MTWKQTVINRICDPMDEAFFSVAAIFVYTRTRVEPYTTDKTQ
jgi:hypothetical protein